jgi:trehalose-6-phosphate synthase
MQQACSFFVATREAVEMMSRIIQSTEQHKLYRSIQKPSTATDVTGKGTAGGLALIVNPNDKFEVAEAIREALRMGHEERVARWRTMIGPLRDRDVSWWAAAFLKELAAQ